MKKVTTGFTRMAETRLNLLLSVITTSMLNNEVFFPLHNEVAVLQVEAECLRQLNLIAANGGKNVILEKNRQKAKVIEIMHVLALQVSAIAKGAEEILLLSGFPYTRTRQTTSLLTQPQPPKVTSGVNHGELACTTKKQKGTKAINFLITSMPEDDNSWKSTPRTRIKHVFSGLSSGTRYYIKVAMLGVRGQVVMSLPSSYISQ